MELSEEDKKQFHELITLLKLQMIQAVQIHAERSKFGALNFENKKFNISWNQAFADGDPLTLEDNRLLFRPRYIVDIKLGDEHIFHQQIVYGIAFTVSDIERFKAIWNKQPVKECFQQKQLMKTLWPYIRQQITDSMNRLDLQAVPLPWIVE